MIVRELIHRLGFDVDDSQLKRFNRTLKTTENNLQGLLSGVENVSRRVRNIGAGLTAFVSLPIAAIGLKSVQTASQLEQMDIAFTTILGDAAKAKTLMKELFDFVKETPFQIKDVQKNAQLLLGMGIEADKLIPTLNAMGNVAAGLSVPLERIALNFGQVRAQGKLTGPELRDFARAGIPIIRKLAEVLGIAESQVRDFVSKGKVSFKDVEKAFFGMSAAGGTFFNLMKKQSKTTAGLWSNLMDSVTLAGAELGREIIRVLRLNKIIKTMAEIIAKAEERFKKLSPPIKTAVILFGLFLVVIGPVILALGALGLAIVSTTIAVLIFKAVILPILPIILAVAAALLVAGIAFALLADDIFQWATGGDSLIGKFLGKFDIFKDRVTKGLKLIRDLFIGFWQAANNGDFTLLETKLTELGPLVLKAIGAILKFLLVSIPNKMLKLGVLMVLALNKAIGKGVDFLLTAFDKFNAFILTSTIKLIKKIGKLLFGSVFGKTILKLAGIDLEKPKEGIEKRVAEIGTGAPGTEKLLGQKPIAQPQPLQFGGLFPKAGSVKTNQINVDSKIEITVPPGNSAQQNEFIKKDVGQVFDDKLSGMLTDAMDTIQKVE